ncbi:hypothetical protein Tco_1292871 [Tanacetum coccineum]
MFPTVVDSYLDTKVGDVFQKELQKHTADLIHKYSLQHLPELTKKPTPTAEQEFEKSPLKILRIKKEQAESQKNPQFSIKSTDKAALEENPANHRLYHALMEAFIEDENVMDKGVADTVKDHKGSMMMMKTMMKTLQLNQTRVRRPRGEELKSLNLLRGHPPPRKPQKEKLRPKALKLHYWNSSEGDRSRFDLSKPLPLQGPPGHRTVATDYFFNNDMEYLKTSDPEVTYTTFITKTKAARYEIKGIKDMVNKFSKQNVYSTKAILGVKSVSVKKLYRYGHLEEIMVKRSDQQLYKFKEGDFVDLHLNDIEDRLLLAVQHKLFYLDGNVIVDFIVALRMFTRSLILKRRVEDLQLGNPTTPSNIHQDCLEDLNKQKRVLRANELYKFSDGTLKSVHDEIRRKVLDFRLDYNTEMPKRKWMIVNRKRSSLMIELIDKQLREKEIIRNIERLVGARELEMDYKL